MVELTDNIAWNSQYSHTTDDLNSCTELLKKADVLKKKVANGHESSDFKDIGDKLADRIALQDLYRKLLISNLEFALDKKIEQDLWNVVFKNYITSLQQKAKDKTNLKRTETQNQLTVFLEAASGFYAQLLQDLCQIFHLVVPCRVPVSQFSISNGVQSKHTSVISQPERPSCQYMCQHCLVHLGDIARYRNQSGQAESYYRHAAQLVPSNGQPYNQLAILAAASGDILSMSFYYCRSLAVKCPFPASSTNLKRQLSKIMDSGEPRHVKISISELIKYFLKFHACIYLKKHDEKLEKMSERLIAYLQLHLRAGSLNQQHLVHITFLNLFSLCHRSLSLSTSPVTDKQHVDQKNGFALEQTTLSWKVLLSFTLQLLDLFLACVPVYSEVDDDLDNIVMPAIKLSLDWLLTPTGTIEMQEMIKYPRLWNNLAALLNALKAHEKVEEYTNLPLPEDLELRGFVGLKEALSRWDFSKGCESAVDISLQHKFRSHRLLCLGSLICERNSQLLMERIEDGISMFECPLEYTNTSPLTVQDILFEEQDTTVVESPSSGSNSRFKSNEVKIARKQTNNTTHVDNKLNAIKEEVHDLHDDGKKKDAERSNDQISSKPTHHVTFQLPDSTSPSPNCESTSPTESWPHKPTTLEYATLQDFDKFRNGMPSPEVNHTPEERDYSIDIMKKQSPVAGFQPYPFVSNTQLQAAQYRNYPIGNRTAIRHQMPANLQDLLAATQSPFGIAPNVPNTRAQTIPMLIPSQNDNIQQQMAQFHSQQTTPPNPYQMMDAQRQGMRQKKIDPMSHNFSSLLAPRFSGLQPPVNMMSANHSFPSDKIPSSWNTGNHVQQNLRSMHTNDSSFPRGVPVPPLPDIRNLIQPQREMHNLPTNEEYGHQFMYGHPLMGQSPDSSNNTSSTSSPTPGMKPVTKTSPQAGTRTTVGPPRHGDFPPASYDLDMQKEANDAFIRAMLNKMNRAEPSRTIPVNDKEFSDKPCREDNPSDMFDISPGSMPIFDKQPPYQLFPESDSTWSIGQGNNRNGNKLGSIGSERAYAQQQQMTSGPPPPQFSPWSDNYQFRSQDFPQPTKPKEQSYNTNTRDNSELLWSSQLNSSGPTALECLLRQQQENVSLHKPPP